MPELYADIARRVSTLCRHVLAGLKFNEDDSGSSSLDEIRHVIGQVDAFQSELTQNLGIDLPKNFNNTWWDLELVYAMALESDETGALPFAKEDEVVEIVNILIAGIREVEHSHGFDED